MADTRRAAVRQDQRVFKWAIILPLAVVASLLFSLVFFNAFYGHPRYKVGLYDATHPVAELSYRGQAFVPTGEPVAAEDEAMVAIAQADEGYLLYAPRGGGGGTGRPERGVHPADYEQLFLRTTDGTYQPVRPRGQR